MNFVVEWTNNAENELAALWLAATDREAVVVASDAIDRLLQDDPNSIGESRDAKRRILFEPPIGVIYRVFDEERSVLVLTCGSSQRTW